MASIKIYNTQQYNMQVRISKYSNSNELNRIKQIKEKRFVKRMQQSIKVHD